ncbi:SDR family NAD(P)-dependent oxidoreductase [Dactylosporangium darangshiense]|uniref:SDR family NAD(P)-dependent oxidoreductase n=1 Tax=Dactylosporangium darangshiense TaxID=579108 RepID=UPI00363ED4DC
MRQARGRLINVTAPTARVAVPFAAPISASKAALAWLSEALRLELSPFGIPVIQVEPGGTRTEIFTKAATAERASLAGADPSVVALYRPSLEAVAASTAKQPLDPVSKATDAIVAAVLDRRPRTHYLAGNARLFATLARLPRGTRDRLLARTLGLPR